MKKLTTLFMGLVIALSAVAAPLGLRHAGKKEITKENALSHVKKVAPKAPAQLTGKTITIEANNLMVDDSWNEMMYEVLGQGYVGIEGSNDEWYVDAALYPNTLEYYGTYSTAEESIALAVYDSEDTEYDLTVSTAELKKTAKGNQFTATAVDEDGNTYNINLTFFAPDEPKDTVVLAYDSCVIEDYTNTEYGVYFVSADRGDTAVQLGFLKEPKAGTYSTDDFDSYYCNVLVFGYDEYEEEDNWLPVTSGYFSIAATITDTETGKNIKAEFFGADSTLYQVSLVYTKPVAKSTTQIELENAYFGDYRDFDGTTYLYAAPADSSYVFSLSPVTETIEGTYTVADLNPSYSYIKLDEKYISFAEGEFTVTLNKETNILTWQGWVLAINNVKYEFVIKTDPSSYEGIEHIELTQTAQKVLVDGVVYIIRDNRLYNLQGVQVR